LDKKNKTNNKLKIKLISEKNIMISKNSFKYILAFKKIIKKIINIDSQEISTPYTSDARFFSFLF